MTPRLWRSGRRSLLRCALIPPAIAYGALVAARRRAAARPWRRIARPPVPTIVIGNLSVGGTGKTPMAQWVARWYASRGFHPGIVLRGVGDDETQLHREALPDAVIVADPDRPRAARRAVADGAEILVVDDGFQRLDLARDLDVVLLSADAADAVGWPLPAGPWREPWSALAGADLIVVTRKAASRAQTDAVAARARAAAGPHVPLAVARLAVDGFRTLRGGRVLAAEAVAGRRVLAAAGIGDPRAFGRQLEALGAVVETRALPDHYAWPARAVDRLLHSVSEVDYVVVTAKDAVKLASRWPSTAVEPLVAGLRLTWERGEAIVHTALAGAAREPMFTATRAGTDRHRR